MVTYGNLEVKVSNALHTMECWCSRKLAVSNIHLLNRITLELIVIHDL